MPTAASASVSRKRRPAKTPRPRLGNTWQDLKWRTALIMPPRHAPFSVPTMPTKRPRKHRLETMAAE